MATSTNLEMIEKKNEIKANAFARIEDNAQVIEEQNKVLELNKATVAKDAEKSGLVERLENHFAKVKALTCEDKDTLVILTSKNIPSSVSVIITKKAKTDGYNVNIVNEAVTHAGTDDNNITEEQVDANTIITDYVDKLTKATQGYVKQVMDICRSWAQLIAACEYQAKQEREKYYNRFANKLDK